MDLRNLIVLSIFVLACTAARNAAAGEAAVGADDDIIYRAGDEWKPVDTSRLVVEEGAALDLGAMNHTPAGRYGRVIAMLSGELAFADRPDEPVRFLGFNWIYGRGGAFKGDTPEQKRESIRLFARAARRQGYNMIRIHCLDTGLMGPNSTEDGVIPDENLDRFDDLVEAFRAEGIYLYLDLGIQNWCKGGWTPASYRGMTVHMFFNTQNSRAIWEKGVSQLLNHKNRHTGVAVKDDPVMAVLLFWNEQDLLTFPWMGYRDGSLALKMFRDDFRAYLAKKYATLDALRAAWENDPALDGVEGFDAVPFTGTEKVPAGPRRAEMSGYYLEKQGELQEFYRSVVVDKLGYPGLHTLWDAVKNRRNAILRDKLSLVCSHDYAAHPSKGVQPGSVIGQNSNAAGASWYFRSMNQTRILGKPFMITEYAQGFWNPYGHEAGLIVPSYAAFQNHQGLMVHSDAVGLAMDAPLDEFVHYRNPVFRANEFLAAHLFRRGDVAPARDFVAMRIDPKTLAQDGAAEDAVNSKQALLALVAGFGLWVDDGEKTAPEGVLALEAVEGARLTSTQYTNAPVADGDAAADAYAEALATLRQRGWLADDNPSDPERKVYQSQTGELTMRPERKFFSALTPKAEAVGMEAGACELGVLRRVETSVDAAVALVSLDDAALPRSRRMVLVYSTDVVNSGMRVSKDRRTLRERGTLPVLMRTGTLEAVISTDRPLKLYALSLDGRRTSELPTRHADGALRISIDTAELPDGPTPFFELGE